MVPSKEEMARKEEQKKYTEAAEKLFIDLWKRLNNKCPEYIYSDIENILKDLSQVRHIEPEEYELVEKMSISTMNRILRKYGLKSPRRRNKRSGSNNIFKEVPCKNAELELPSVIGEVQIDTVQMCGDSSTGSSWWITYFVHVKDLLAENKKMSCVKQRRNMTHLKHLLKG